MSAGDSVELVLENRSSEPVGYNLCVSDLERSRDGDWVPVPEDRVCTLELRTLPPGEEDRFGLTLLQGLDPGEYRFSTRVERLETGERALLVGEVFRVEA